MGTQRIIILSGGAVAMLILMLLCRKHFPQIQIWKYPVIAILLTLSGVAGAMLMNFIETGSFNGTSYFGAVLFVPILMLPALLLHVPYGHIMDLCAPAECLMLAFMKMDCLMSGCCIGKYLPALGFQFPSQIVELLNALVLMFLLLRIEQRSKNQNKLYAYYLISYGITRFILNWFRYGLKPFVWILPAGHFWSVVSIVLGLLWLLAISKHNPKNKQTGCLKSNKNTKRK